MILIWRLGRDARLAVISSMQLAGRAITAEGTSGLISPPPWPVIDFLFLLRLGHSPLERDLDAAKKLLEPWL